jgi:hypothetical protein
MLYLTSNQFYFIFLLTLFIFRFLYEWSFQFSSNNEPLLTNSQPQSFHTSNLSCYIIMNIPIVHYFPFESFMNFNHFYSFGIILINVCSPIVHEWNKCTISIIWKLFMSFKYQFSQFLVLGKTSIFEHTNCILPRNINTT